MKKEDKYIMQITTIHKIQNAFDTSLNALKFIWRHAFVLISLGITIQGICEGKTPIIEGEALIFTVAAFIDWLKMRLKFSRVHNNSREQMFESARKNRDDLSWKMNALNPMGYTYSSYNSANKYY